jgi:hypothetical protein
MIKSSKKFFDHNLKENNRDTDKAVQYIYMGEGNQATVYKTSFVGLDHGAPAPDCCE